MTIVHFIKASTLYPWVVILWLAKRLYKPPFDTHVGSALVPYSSCKEVFGFDSISSPHVWIQFRDKINGRPSQIWDKNLKPYKRSPIKGALLCQFTRTQFDALAGALLHRRATTCLPELDQGLYAHEAELAWLFDAIPEPEAHRTKAFTIAGTHSQDPPIVSCSPIAPPSCKLHRWILCVMPPP
jgi:hypothetical protein